MRRCRRRLWLFVVGLAAVLAAGFISPSQAVAATATIYVAPGGSDSAAGTSAAPIKTLSEAQTRVRAAVAAGNVPVTVELADGTYPLSRTLTMTEQDSGTSTAPVTWKAAAGAHPVIAGGRSLTPAWSTYSGQIRVATIGADLDFDQLLVNDKRQILARYPNYDPTKRLGGYASDAIAPSRVATWAHPETALVRGLHDREWGGNSFRATGRNSDGSLAMTWVGDNQRGSGLHGTYRMVENVFEELDSPGEWFYDKTAGKLYYWPSSGVDLSTAGFRLGELNELIRVQGTGPSSPAHDIAFTGITFTATHRTLFNSTFEPISLSDWAIVRKAAVALKNTARINVTSSTFDQLGGNALFMDGYADHNTVRGNVFTEDGASAVAIVGSESSARQASTWGHEKWSMTDTTPGPATQDYPRDITVADNLITKIGTYEKQTAGVQISRAARVTVSHNTIHDVPRAAINIGDGTFGGHLLTGNDIWNAVRETGDHGPINSWGRDRFWPISGATNAQRKAWSQLDQVEANIIEYNRIWHDSEWAVDLDDGASQYIVRNNLFLNGGTKFREGFNRISTNNIYAGGSAHFHVSYADNGDSVTSNVFLGGVAYEFIQADPAYSKIGYDKNVFWNNGGSVSFTTYGSSLAAWQQSKSQDMGSIVADPKFTGASPWVDPSKKDWTLDSTSPALSRGFVQIPMGSFGRPGSIEGPPALTWAAQPETSSRETSAEPWLGAQITGIDSDTLASSVGLAKGQGIYLASVPPGSAAESAGLRVTDVIRKINGTAVTWKNSFWTIWNQLGSGSSVQLEIYRNQAASTITLTRPGGTEKINNTSGVVYTGSGWDWKDANRGGDHGYLNDIDASTTSGDSFTLAFTGTRLTMSTETNSDETTMMISVDNGPEQAVSLNTTGRVYQSQVFDTGKLTDGTHTVKARSTNSAYFIVDSFTITRPTNVALGKPAIQSSTLNSARSAAGKAVDGNTNGNYFAGSGSVTHTSDSPLDANPWWQVDLGSSQQVSSINLWNRTDCCGSRLRDFYVFTSDSPFTSNDPNVLKNQSGVKSVYQSAAVGTSLTVPVSGTARYVRVQLVGSDRPLSLAEVQVLD